MCNHENVSLATSASWQAVCADCGAVVERREDGFWVEADKPYPGPEHRLLEKDPDELLEFDDQFLASNGSWYKSYNANHGNRKQDAGTWYRRKIEQQNQPMR
jgi:hypothetical protein